MNNRLRVAKNAVANLLRGGATTLVTVLLPAVLVRHMSQTEYAVWVLVLQVAAYSVYLESGMQTAVGRYLAISIDQSDPDRGNSIYSTALLGLCIAGVIATLAIIVIAFGAGSLFPSIPRQALPHMRWALVIAGTSMSLGLPSYAWIGVFVGLQRNEFIAFVSGGAKILAGIGVAVAVIEGASVVTMAIVFAVVNIASYLLLHHLAMKFSHVRFRPHLVDKATARELFHYCFGLIVWSFSMLLVNGLDLTLVGRFQFSAVAPYAIATILVNSIQGIQLAIFHAAMPHAAVLHARKDVPGLGRLLLNYTRLGVLLLTLVGAPLMIYARPLLRIWVGQQYAAQGHMLLFVLVLANIIRLTCTPYTVLLVATGQQRLVTLSPAIEGVANLLASIFLGIRFGAAGVAAGTLLGAVIGFLGHVLYNIPRTRREIGLGSREFLLSGVGTPLLVSLPLLVLAALGFHAAMPRPITFGLALAVTVALAATLVYRARAATGHAVTLAKSH